MDIKSNTGYVVCTTVVGTSTWPAAAVCWVVSSFEIVCIHRGDDRCVVGACTDSYVRTVSKSVS